LILGGTKLAPNSMVASMTLLDNSIKNLSTESGKLWMGSPAQSITNSQLDFSKNEKLDSASLFYYFVETLVVLILNPVALVVSLAPSVLFLEFVSPLVMDYWISILLLIPVGLLLEFATPLLLTFILRWTTSHPYFFKRGFDAIGLATTRHAFTMTCWSNFLAFGGDLFLGTFIFNLILKMFGYDIGKEVYYDSHSVNVVESRFFKIGDFAVFNQGGIYAHRYKDGKIQLLSVKVGDGCILDSCVLSPGSEIGSKTTFLPLTTAHMQETFPPNLTWQGSIATVVDKKM